MELTESRAVEHQKYIKAYEYNRYSMGMLRFADARRDLEELNCLGSLLDVGCGRGEIVTLAEQMGFDLVRGVDLVPDLLDGERIIQAEVHNLPFNNDSFNVATMFDVIEHLLPGDDELACRELKRVAIDHILITANNKRSFNKAGDDLHINKKTYEVWNRLFHQWFDGCEVTWLKGHTSVSESWRIDLRSPQT